MRNPDATGRGLVGRDASVRTPDGRSLHIMVGGAGDDLVVLESGLGTSGLFWGPVHEVVARDARVVAYDRAGYGGSTFDPLARDLDRLAADLGTVIDAHPHRRLVLVGHSWGGPVVRVLAARRLARGLPPAGLVLVDQSDENSDLYFDPKMQRRVAAWARFMVPLARLRLFGRLNRGLAAGLPSPLDAAVVAASSSVPAARSTLSELRHLVDGLSALRDRPALLDGVPVTIISGQKATPTEAATRASLIAAHRETARGLPGSRFVPAEESGHMIPVTEPGLVAAEALAFFR